MRGRRIEVNVGLEPLNSQGVMKMPTWKYLPGQLARDIGVGPTGSVWIIGDQPVGAGTDGVVLQMVPNLDGSTSFLPPPDGGGGVRIAVDDQGHPWLVNSFDQIFARGVGGSVGWQQATGLAKDIGVGVGPPNESVWAIGTNHVGAASDFGVFRFNDFGAGWSPLDGGGVRIAVDPTGHPWMVNSVGEIYQHTNSGWRNITDISGGRARDIGVGGDGTVWVIGTDNVPGGGTPFQWTGSIWKDVAGGGATQISVDPSGLPWIVNSDGAIFHLIP
jgi:hypothetical protein